MGHQCVGHWPNWPSHWAAVWLVCVPSHLSHLVGSQFVIVSFNQSLALWGDSPISETAERAQCSGSIWPRCIHAKFVIMTYCTRRYMLAIREKNKSVITTCVSARHSSNLPQEYLDAVFNSVFCWVIKGHLFALTCQMIVPSTRDYCSQGCVCHISDGVSSQRSGVGVK